MPTNFSAPRFADTVPPGYIVVSWLFTEKRWHVSRGAGYVVPQETWDRYQKAEMVVWQIHDEIIGQHAYIGSIDRANPNQRNQP